MKLTVLVDNNTLIDRYYLGEPGVCYYIEDGDKRLLLDVGYSDVFLKNAHLLNIDLASINTIAISHGHNDHTRGLQYLKDAIDLNKLTIVAHPDAFQTKMFAHESIGAPFSRLELAAMSRLLLSTKPVKISSNITFLGEIPSSNMFEQRQPFGFTFGANTSVTDDYVMDDTALVYQNDNGLFIITGCSHSGICNIVEYAKQVCHEQRIIGIIGGFHLLEVSEQLNATIDYFVDNKIDNLYPCHCVSFSAKAAINKSIPIHEVGVGLTIEIE